jgi:hypothetical protein
MNGVFDMAVSSKLVGDVLASYACFFEVPNFVQDDASCNGISVFVCEVWASLFRDFTEDEFKSTARKLAFQLTTWPIPADFYRAMAPSNGDARKEGVDDV